MLGERQRLEALGIGLIALGVLVALATIYPAFTSPERNLIGPAGAALYSWTATALGFLAFVAALPALLWGLRLLGLIGWQVALRGTILAVGAALLLPAAYWALSARGERAAELAGWLGRTVGAGLETGFGIVGALLILVALVVVLAVSTLGISPGPALRWSGRGLRRVATATGRVALLAWRFLFDLYSDQGGGPDRTPWEEQPASPDEEESPLLEVPLAGNGRGRALEQAQLSLPDPGDLALTELPPLELLSEARRRGSGLEKRELKSLGDILIHKLATFRIDGEIGGWTTGPVVTQFEVVPAAGVKVGQIAARADDLALALRAPSVRIVAPIPGKGAVGVEVPNPEPEIVALREVLEAPDYRRSSAELPLALGRDLSGRPYSADLTRMPHLLIAGATGTGKSVCMNTIVTSLIYRYTPKELRLLMIDPKMVELSVYGDLPHLRHPVVTDNDEAASIFKWAVYEMKRRFGLLSANGCRNIREFNARIRDGRELRLPGSSVPAPDENGSRLYDEGELPYIVLLIDELADLIMTVQAEVETPLAMLAQKARAVGLHLVVATQRPSVNVITGLIKANFPSRIAFRVASKTDSRTILDQNGAESLLGNGDMLFLPPGESDPVRIQGAYVSSEETEQLLQWYRDRVESREAGPEEERDIMDVIRELEEREARSDVSAEVLEERDALFRPAAEIVVTNASGSTSLLQRRLKIGYGRAARIIDQLHHAGVVGPAEGSRPREIMVTLQDLDEVLDGR